MAVATDPIDLVFSGAQHKQLTEALEQAYPSYQQLEMMVRHRLDLNLQSISSSYNKLNYVAFELIKSRQAAGELLRLVAAAQASQPNNPRLAAVASALGLAADAPPRAELEKIVKKTSVPFDIAVWRERMAAREVCVCRMEVPVAGGTSFGTGFLVGPDLVLTNHHVIAGATDPAAIVARFDYKARAGGGTISPGVEVHLAAEWLVDSSPHSPVDLEGLPKKGVPDPELLDYALLRLANPVGDEPIPAGKEAEPGAPPRGWIALPSKPWPFATNRSLFIIQHPSGSPMKLAMDLEATMAVNANGTRVTYQTGTEGGSSGSPCFNQLWDLVALHHAGDPSHSDFYDPAFNEGIPIDRIVARLDARGLTAGLTLV